MAGRWHAYSLVTLDLWYSHIRPSRQGQRIADVHKACIHWDRDPARVGSMTTDCYEQNCAIGAIPNHHYWHKPSRIPHLMVFAKPDVGCTIG